MKVLLRDIQGNWDRGVALNKHTLSSTFSHYDEYGHARFDTVRSDVGEAVYKLKYQSDWAQADELAKAIEANALPLFDKIGMIVPMKASTQRARQPVDEVAKALGKLIDVPIMDTILVRQPLAEGETPLKNLHTREEKDAVLKNKFSIADEITNSGKWNTLVLDDLYDSGASMNAACAALRGYPKVNRIFAVALTWK